MNKYKIVRTFCYDCGGSISYDTCHREMSKKEAKEKFDSLLVHGKPFSYWNERTERFGEGWYWSIEKELDSE